MKKTLIYLRILIIISNSNNINNKMGYYTIIVVKYLFNKIMQTIHNQIECMNSNLIMKMID